MEKIMSNIISKTFNRKEFYFEIKNGVVYLNATKTALEFEKRLDNWKNSKDVNQYIEALSKHLNLGYGDLVVSKRGGNNKNEMGTWLHPKLIIFFARWLSPDFAVWCDFQIEEILNSKTSTEPDLELIRKRTELLKFSGEQFEVFEKIFLKIGISEKNELAITSNHAVAKETGIDFIQLAELKGLEAKEKFYSVTELCEVVRNSDQFSNEFKIQVSTKDGLKPRPQNLNLLLEFSEFQFRENGEWKLTKKGEDFGKLSQNKSKYSDKTVYHLVWSKKVLELLK
jgi:hypothetical protein